MKINRKGQAMLEYLLIVGAVLLLVIAFAKDVFMPTVKNKVLGNFAVAGGAVDPTSELTQGAAGALAIGAEKYDIE